MRYLSLCLLIACLTLLCVGATWANNAANDAANLNVGAAELQLVNQVLTGNIGLAIGLLIAIIGIITFVQGNVGNGIFIVVLGVLITLLPGVFKGVRLIACPIVSSLGGECGGK